ncbi:MAG TPA: hypothetical protein VG458_08220 [Solirubrobacterales bacterium]|nr:hypothetical protein [Solirubrobacterales bacterium]
MELMAWTDARLEERFAHIDTRFDRLEAVVAVKAETRELRKEVARLADEVQTLRDDMTQELRALRTEMTEEFRALRSEMHRDRRGLIIALIALIGAFLVGGG